MPAGISGSSPSTGFRPPPGTERAARSVRAAEQIAAGMAASPEKVKGYVAGFREAGCDELILAPGSASLDQVTALAEAIA